jgi:hypothetical protein
MTTFCTPAKPRRKKGTIGDFDRRFGPIPFERSHQNPPPGAATVADIVRLTYREDVEQKKNGPGRGR